MTDVKSDESGESYISDKRLQLSRNTTRTCVITTDFAGHKEKTNNLRVITYSYNHRCMQRVADLGTGMTEATI